MLIGNASTTSDSPGGRAPIRLLAELSASFTTHFLDRTRNGRPSCLPVLRVATSAAFADPLVDSGVPSFNFGALAPPPQAPCFVAAHVGAKTSVGKRKNFLLVAVVFSATTASGICNTSATYSPTTLHVPGW